MKPQLKIKLYKIKKLTILLLSLTLAICLIIINIIETPASIPPNTNDTIIDSVWVNDTLYIYETIYETVHIHDTVTEPATELIVSDTNTYDNNTIERDFLAPTSYLYIPTQSIFNKIITYPDYTVSNNFGIFKFSLFNSQINIENIEFKDLLNESLFPRYGYSIENNINFSKNNFLFETGTSYTSFFENFKFYKEEINIDTSNYYEIFEQIHFDVDTIWFLDLDSLLIGDTVWLPYYDSTEIIIKDSVLNTDIDTSKNIYDYNYNNSFSYIEIPIIFGYSTKYKNFTFSVKTGLIFGFLTKTKGKIFIYEKNFQIKPISEVLNFPKVSLSSYLAIGIKYQFFKHFGINLEPFFRLPISAMYQNSTISRKYISYGVKFGFQFYF